MMLNYNLGYAKQLANQCFQIMVINGKIWYYEVSMRVKGNDNLVLLILLLIGAIFGSLIGELLSDVAPVLNYGKSIGVDPFVVDLNVIELTFGLRLSLNLSGIIGLIIAFVLYKKL